MDAQQYRRFKKSLNDISFYGMEKLSMGDILSIPVAYLEIGNKYNFVRAMLSILSMSMTVTYEYNIIDTGIERGKKILFFFSHMYASRSDYISIINNVTNLFHNRCNFTGRCVDNRYKRKVSIAGMKNLWLIPIWIFQMRKIPYSINLRLYLIADIFEAKRWFDYSKKTIKPEDYSALITFFDARLYDNILVQCFKQHNIPTATLQHGHFIASKTKARNMHELDLCFEGFISDKMFVWGEYTKNEAIKNGIEPSRIQSVGCPKYIGYKKQDKKHINHLFGIVLDGEGAVNCKSNIEMIKIANEVAKVKAIKYVMKPHPVSDMSVFDEFIDYNYLYRIASKSESVEEYSESIDFSLASGSTVYMELLYLGNYVFRFVCDGAIDFYETIDWGIVKTADDFINLIDIYENNPRYVSEMNKKAADILCEHGDIGENYCKAINELINLKYEKEKNFNGK